MRVSRKGVYYVLMMIFRAYSALKQTNKRDPGIKEQLWLMQKSTPIMGFCG